MQKDLSQIEGALRKNERDIEAIDDEIKGLEGAISGMQSEIVNLGQQKANCLELSVWLKVRLGQIPSPKKAPAVSVGSDEDDGDFVVPKNFVKGMGPADGALKILRKVGKPMSHPVLVQALLKGNVQSESKNTDVVFRTAIGRRKEFVWIKKQGARNVWALREWPGYENYETAAKVQTLEPTENRPSLALVTETELSSSARA
jgi:hypothetical protein